MEKKTVIRFNNKYLNIGKIKVFSPSSPFDKGKYTYPLSNEYV